MLIDFNELKIQESYFCMNYASEYIPEQGTDVILNIIQEYSKPGSWIDLGGGANTFFWSIPFNNPTKIVNVDRSMESLLVCESAKLKKFNEGCYKYWIDSFGIDVNRVYNREIEYIMSDLLNDEITSQQFGIFDNVTQFGLFGLCVDIKSYESKLLESMALLKNKGIFIGANWKFKPDLIRERDFNNNYMSTEMIINICSNNTLSLLYCKEIIIKNDLNYKSIILYVIRK